MSILHLTQEKKWFDMTAEGIKKEEYRHIKPYWVNRLLTYSHTMSHEDWYPDELCKELLKFPHDWDTTIQLYGGKFRKFECVQSRNGYGKNAPVIKWTHIRVRVGSPNPEWCPPEFHGQTFFILEIGEIIK